MNYYVYILQSTQDKKYYVGIAKNPQKRLDQHNMGKVLATKKRRPLTLIYAKEYPSREEAVAKEKFLKSPQGAKEKFSIIENIKT